MIGSESAGTSTSSTKLMDHDPLLALAAGLIWRIDNDLLDIFVHNRLRQLRHIHILAAEFHESVFDSAITKSRTLLEETFCYVIEKKGETPSALGNISDLYRQVKDLYNMHGDTNTDRRIIPPLSG